MRNNSFAISSSFLLQRLGDLTRGVASNQIWQPYYLLHLKQPSIQLFLDALFKIFAS